MSTTADFVTITSSDGYSFIVDKKLVPNNLTTNLPYEFAIVEAIIEYLHYKHLHQHLKPKSLPKFQIEPILALEVLKAAIELSI